MDTINNDLRHIQQIYEQYIKPLPRDERLHLIEVTAHDLSKQKHLFQRKWQELAGSAPHLLADEDAQAWVSRTRQESEVRRECLHD